MTILSESIDDVDVEIKFVNSSRKKQKTVIDHYEFIKQLNNFYFYKIWIADDLKLQEDEKIRLKSSGVSIDAVVISAHETQYFTIRTTTKLTEEIYYVTRLFDPTFILDALKQSLSSIDISSSELLRKIIEKLIHNEAIEINDESQFLDNLNQAQKVAILLTESTEVSLIWGPPGTGKTHTLSQIIYRAFLRDEKVLVLSTSNVAIDQVILYLDKFLYSDEKKYVLRLGYTDDDICMQYIRDSLSSIDESIVFSTLATATLKNEKLLEVSFDLVIVDEASMVSLPYAFLAASMSSRNIVYTGDFRQLPPIALAEKTSLSENIFDYLRVSEKIDKNISPPYLALLDTQYRMCRDISDVVSSLFYKNLLKCGVDQFQKGKLEFINIDRASGYYDSYYSIEYKSYYNPITIAILAEKFNQFNNSTFLFISPYRAQQNIISYYLIDRNYKNGRSLTVHKSQGSEADIVVFD
ncbi:MAG: AAA domain-containing protein, partial [Methylotenera sp.]|nr:AAA domain-containing protein [Methylotenera sp.]